MKKKIAVFMAAGLLITAAACSKAPEETQKETQKETTATTAAQSEETSDAQESKEEYSSDVDSQMKIIARSYDFIKSDYYAYTEGYPDTSFAVTDLNHNGRLEIIVSSTQSSLSNTFFYEISEDYSSLERLRVNGDDKPDAAGDFIMSTSNEDHTVSYDCYMKDGEYYYLLEDVASLGWSYKFMMYYSYSFGNGVSKDFIGGVECSAERQEEKTIVNTWLYGPSGTLFGSDEEYLEHLNSFWNDYERMDACDVRWMRFADDTNFPDAIAESYDAFSPNSMMQTSITYDYHYFLDRIYGEDGNTEFEYVIKDSRPENAD